MERWLQKQWQTVTLWQVVLIPLSWVFALLSLFRRVSYRRGWLRSERLPVPVIVVGNISVGGTGKTPLVIWLVEQLKAAGYHPGVISRGYGGRVTGVRQVTELSSPGEVGDEPLLVVNRAQCPVWVSSDRVKAGKALLEAHPECDVIVSDDGLQHYALQRDVELVVVDGVRGFGHARLLPAGSLREPLDRLKMVDAVVCNGSNIVDGAFLMTLQIDDLVNLVTGKTQAAQCFANQNLHAIAGIGHPERFFATLTHLGLSFTHAAFSDHHAYRPDDLVHFQCDALLMTEKDAVKCKAFAQSNYWYLPVSAKIEGDLFARICAKLK